MSVKAWYFSTPDQVPPVESDGMDNVVCVAPNVAVVIDVLRAPTTIAALLERGAEAVEAFDDIRVLKQAASAW